jgi:ribose 1,5-bisphosphate isomerase
VSEAFHPELEATAERIASMEIRGAATIAGAAAEALATQARASDAADPAAFRREHRRAGRRLYDTRPTAVSLPNALRYVLDRMDGDSVAELRASVVDAAEAFQTRLGEPAPRRRHGDDPLPLDGRAGVCRGRR